MRELFVDYDTALELKELGFNEDCLAWYNYDEKSFVLFNQDLLLDSYAGEYKRPLAPLKAQVFKYFREKYDIFVAYQGDFRKCYFDIVKEGIVLKFIEAKTHEEAENECIKQIIIIIKENKYE